MTQVTAEMQEIIDRFGWAEGWPTVAKAAMDLCKHLDARLIALEAAKPQAQPGWFDVAKQYAAEVDDLRNINTGLRRDNERLRAIYEDMGLIGIDVSGRDNERLRAIYEADNAQLRAALESVEWDKDDTCPWCHGRRRGFSHSAACQRQAALR